MTISENSLELECTKTLNMGGGHLDNDNRNKINFFTNFLHSAYTYLVQLYQLGNTELGTYLDWRLSEFLLRFGQICSDSDDH